MTKGQFITDDELRELGVSEIDIDALNFNERTQKGKATRPTDARYLPAVKEVLAARGVMLNHDKR